MTLFERYQQLPFPQKVSEGDPRFIYLLYSTITDLYKIGITDHPDDRVNHINNHGLGIIVVSVAFAEDETKESMRVLEQVIHYHFREQWVVGEWFRLCTRDLVSIRALAYEALLGCEEGLSTYSFERAAPRYLKPLRPLKPTKKQFRMPVVEEAPPPPPVDMADILKLPFYRQ